MIETNKKPKVFIGSSRESIAYVDAIHGRLRNVAEVTPWHTALREAHAYNMEELERALHNVDFAVFVFSPDDVVKIRGQIFYTARDNTLFELGLFWGKLERRRVFYLIPDKLPEQTNGEPSVGLRLASDLDGIAPLTYEVREDKNYDAAVSFSCSKIIRRIQELGPFDHPAKIIEQLEKKNTDKAHALQFLVPFSKALMEKEADKYEVLYESLRSAYTPPARFKVSGGAVFKATDKGLSHAAGNENRETFIPYDIKGGKPGEKLVADCFLNSEERALLINDLLVKTYLICYPF
jgi:predicted nucleotide-binding protein